MPKLYRFRRRWPRISFKGAVRQKYGQPVPKALAKKELIATFFRYFNFCFPKFVAGNKYILKMMQKH